MSYLRTFILNQSRSVIDSINRLLGSFWNDYHLFVWNTNKSCSSFQGPELRKFVDHTYDIVSFLEKTFEATEHLQHISDSLRLWKQIFIFLDISHVRDIGW